MTADVTRLPSARDALIAEMLGDIGRLHDAVASLKDTLPVQTREVEVKITGLVELLMKASDGYRAYLDRFTAAQLQRVRHELDEHAQAVTSAAVAEIARAVRTGVQAELAAPVQQLQRLQQRCRWQSFGLGLAGGLLAAALAIGFGLSAVRPDDAVTSLGKAAVAAWDQLDAKARTAILAQRRP